MKPLKITAHLVDGFVSRDKWSPSIDGILAYQHMMQLLGPDQFAIDQGDSRTLKPIVGLPLKTIEHGDLWWYACSRPIYASAARLQKHYHRRFDQLHSDRIDFGKKSGKVVVHAGPYKNYRRSIYKTMTSHVDWHVVGDRDVISAHLNKTTHIGAKLSQGYGEVRDWEISDGNESEALFNRPLPLDYAAENNIEGVTLKWAIRPPARLQENNTQCVMPT